jgi:protein involved in polysaccharide export with SLBB domain
MMIVLARRFAFLLPVWLSAGLSWGQVATPPATPSGADPIKTSGVLTRISPNDVIEMRVYQEADLDSRAKVSSDGRVALPLIGEVMVGGMSATDARDVIIARYKKGYLVNPQLSITVVEQTRRSFTILGEVNRPSAYTFPANETLSLMQAIGFAGGYTKNARKSKIKIKRLLEGGREKIIEINGETDAESNGKPFLLQPGDIISVGESIF